MGKMKSDHLNDAIKITGISRDGPIDFIPIPVFSSTFLKNGSEINIDFSNYSQSKQREQSFSH